MCHRTVLFLIVRDGDGSRFRFAPLFGETFNQHVPAEARESLPDSLVMVAPDGRRLLRAEGVFHALKRVGGFWGLVGTVGDWIPTAISGWGYDRIAAVRKRLFRRPDDVCPVVPPELRDRFAP